MTGKSLFELANTIEAPAQARVHVQRHLCPEHGDDVRTAAQIAVTELATCAFLYGKAPIMLELECGVSHLRVALTHRVEGAPVTEIPIDEDGGLRSALLVRFSGSWGVDAVAEGRQLWCCLPTGVTPVRGGPPPEATRGAPARPG